MLSVLQRLGYAWAFRGGGAENARLENARTDWLWKDDQA